MERDDMMHKARAALAYTQSCTNAKHQAKVEMAAFLDLFHPNMDPEAKATMIREAGE